MKIFFSTVVRSAPVSEGGSVFCLDWQTKRIEYERPIAPQAVEFTDPNPRGNSRGGRGIAFCHGELIVANYFGLKYYDLALNLKRTVSDGLMVGLHETHLVDEHKLWVTSTSIDAAVAYDVNSGDIIDQYWPRETLSFQEKFKVEPLAIDKEADNRVKFLEATHAHDSSHVHLNAVFEWNKELFGLFNRHGAIVNLTKGTTIVVDSLIKKGHNLLITDDGTMIVNGTVSRTICFYDVHTGQRKRVIDLSTMEWVKKLARWHDVRFQARRALLKVGMKSHLMRPIFVRGLDLFESSLFIGISPASILQVDIESGRLVDWFNLTNNIRVCVHGIFCHK